MVPNNDLENTTQENQSHTIYTNKKNRAIVILVLRLYCIETMRELLDIQSAFFFSWHGRFFFERFCISVSVYNKL